VQHLGAQTHRIDVSPLGFCAKKLAVKLIFWQEIQILKKENGIISPTLSNRIEKCLFQKISH
jgi:hypothetical protein